MKEKQIEKVYSTNRNFKEEKNMDLMNELLNCLNSTVTTIYLTKITWMNYLITRDKAPASDTPNGVELMKK